MASVGANFTIIERCAVAPPPLSTPPATLPLTFFDIPWLVFPQSQPLFFFASTATAAEFTQTLLPNLKHSLSLALRRFFPLAGKLVLPAALSAEPRLDFRDGDAVLLTAAVAAAADGGEFKNLSGNHRRSGGNFRRLVPEMVGGGGGGELPILAVQITLFPQIGICIGFNLRNVAADWRSFNNFLKDWAFLCKNGDGGGDEGRHVACHDRSVMLDPCGLRSFFLTEFWKIKNNLKEKAKFDDDSSKNNEIIRATFVLGPKEMGRVKKWILTRSDLLFGSAQLLLSPYVLACAFIWVCWIKTHWPRDTSRVDRNDFHYFGFIAGGLTRLPFVVPSNYVGNCVGFGRAAATRFELVGEDGVVFAAKAIGDTVKRLNGDMLGGARSWISEWRELRESELHLTVTGSPKLDLYGLDFGWGRPVKFEEASIDATGAISLSESREVSGGIEIGVALPRLKMDVFTVLFNDV